MARDDVGTRPYQRVMAQILVLIREEGLQPGQRLPSTRALAAEYGVAEGTVTRALRELQTAGHITGRQGSGSYVADPAKPATGEASVEELQRQVAFLSARLAFIEDRLPASFFTGTKEEATVS